jgi:hypothetical protein
VHAQGSGPVWVSFDGQPAGTPARVLVDPELSTRDQTYLDVSISGFFVTTRTGDDGRIYQDLSVPGLPSLSTPGEPRLPVVRADLAMSTDAASAAPVPATVLDLRELPGYQIWPSPIPAELHDGVPSQFTRNEAIYGAAATFPVGDGMGSPTRKTLGGIPATLCTAFPFHWNPASGTLEVAAHARFGFTHAGGLMTPMGISREHSDGATATFPNWGAVSPDYTVDWTQYNGTYLFVCPTAWMQDLKPLIDQKKTRGFAVSVVNVPLSGETCAQLRQSIQNWYAGTPQGADHYCLLVGGFGSTPYCADINGQVSDKVLSSVDGDGEPEIYLGRLYVGSTAELQTQVQKILDYEIGGQVNNDGNVLLVAHHQQDQDFDFASYQDQVLNAVYAQVTPVFTTIYGTNPAIGNADIKSAIEGQGVGVVAYMGHGEPADWLHWSFAHASYAHADAAALANGSLRPVVWSIACQTADPRVGSNLASGFMKNAQGGAVAFYGAVDQTYGSIVSVLNDSLFQAVYGRGITRHGLAIAYGEHATIAADPWLGVDAAYKYVLYGDPEMSIKRENFGGPSVTIDLITPLNFITPCPGIDCCPTCPAPVIDIQAVGAGGAPVPDVKIGIWKPRLGETDQVLANQYSGADGWVHIPAPGLTGGTLYVGFDDSRGHAGLDSIPVSSLVTGAEGPVPAALHLVATPNVTSGRTRLLFGRALATAASVRIYRVDGRLARALPALKGSAFVDWDGRDQSGAPVASGVYLATLEADRTRVNARIVLVR